MTRLHDLVLEVGRVADPALDLATDIARVHVLAIDIVRVLGRAMVVVIERGVGIVNECSWSCK